MAHLRVCWWLHVLGASYARVQATEGVGTVLIWLFGIAYTRERGTGFDALHEWWQVRAPSPLQKRVFSLILQPTSGGDVERFFSQFQAAQIG